MVRHSLRLLHELRIHIQVSNFCSFTRPHYELKYKMKQALHASLLSFSDFYKIEELADSKVARARSVHFHY